MAENESTGLRKSVKNQRLFLRFWSGPELLLLGGLFSLGVLIFVIHLLTWGIPAWKESVRLVRGECYVEKLILHKRTDQNGNLAYRP